MNAGKRVDKRRRRENKTDYLLRKKILSGEMPRIVVRKTNKFIQAQYVTSYESRDKIELTENSKKLLKYGWPENMKGSLKSLPACYLTGFLLGKKIAKEKKPEKVAIDLGLLRTVPKSRIYALLKGLVDAGVKTKVNEKVFPDEKRLKGEHMKKKVEFEKIKSEILKK